MIDDIVEHQLACERQIAPDRAIASVSFDELSLKKRHKRYATVMSDLSDPEHTRILAVAKLLGAITDRQRKKPAAISSH